MKHSKDTSGLSKDSLVVLVVVVVVGHLPSVPLSISFLVCSIFRVLVSVGADLTRLGDLFVLLADGLRPMTDLFGPLSTRVAGDLDRLLEASP
jgi:hypothetical protein